MAAVWGLGTPGASAAHVSQPVLLRRSTAGRLRIVSLAKTRRGPGGSIADQLAIFCEAAIANGQWQLVNARRLIHWMPFDEVTHFLSTLPRIVTPGCPVALCFQTAKETSGTLAIRKTPDNFFYHHAPQDVLQLMQERGYVLLDHGRGPQGNARAYRIFAAAPSAA